MKFNLMFVIAALLIAAASFTSAAHVDVGIAVAAPPPPPPVGAITPIGVPPGPGYVWVPGYWNWVGGQWVWVGGAWVLPPRAHAVWVEPAIEYRWHRGHWR